MRRERRLPGRRGQRVAEDQLGVESIDNGGQGDRQLHAPAQDCPRLWMEADFLDLVAKPGYKKAKDELKGCNRPLETDTSPLRFK